MSVKFKLALCQMKVVTDKLTNLDKAESMIRSAALNGSRIISLPEIFNCPYSNKFFRQYAEDDSGPTVGLLSRLAKELSVYIIGGSIPELAGDSVYNTCYIINSKGDIIGKHRKIHLFDIDVKGGISVKESDSLTAGENVTVIDTEYARIGVAICYDIRFPELIRMMTLKGAQLIVLPAAFSAVTGPAHWDIVLRTRAVDNQVYLAAVSPARDMEGPYQAYGHSCIITPWGDYAALTDHRESVIYGDIDLDYMYEIRNQLPLLKHRRPDLYE